MRRNCTICGRLFDAKQARAQYCGSTCRNRKRRGSAPPPQAGDGSSILNAAKAQLDAAGQTDSVLGQQVLRLAEQMSVETGSSLAALNRELRATMAEVLGVAKPAEDPLDELRRRREARRTAG